MLDVLVGIARFFGSIFIEFFIQGLLAFLLYCVELLGFWLLKIITFSYLPITELKIKYKDSAKPYFAGFGFLLGIGYLLCCNVVML